MAFDIQCNIEKVDTTICGLFEHKVDIWGWALTAANQVPQISIYNDEVLNYDVKYQIRADVCSAFNLSDSCHCGFHISIVNKNSCRELVIIFYDSDGGDQKKEVVYVEYNVVNEVLFFLRKVIHLVRHEGLFSLSRKIVKKVNCYLSQKKNIQNPEPENTNQTLAEAISCLNRNHPPFVPLLKSEPLKSKPVRLIGFYAPWGASSSDWTAIKTAQPQFEGHCQPQLPGDLGCYNPYNPQTLKRQVDLARLYGLEGFCFYFNSGDDQRILEDILNNFLTGFDHDFPFCLCYANENRTSQYSSEKYVLELMVWLVKYMEDHRYIKINNKPLLIVSRPDLLPDVKKVTTNWRKSYSESGNGEIYLAYLQANNHPGPDQSLFDAAIEYPPGTSLQSLSRDSINPVHDDLMPMVYDWRLFIDHSYTYKKPPFSLFRGICPSWDNTPRGNPDSSVFVFSSAFGYQEWLRNAIVDTVVRFKSPEEKLIFINAWNRWGDGAYLEPDQEKGYAYLEATRMALVRNKAGQYCNKFEKEPLAVVIHAYYEDIFEEFLTYLEKVKGLELKLYISTIPEKHAIIEAIMRNHQLPYRIFSFKNHGRDILPFLKILPHVFKGGHRYLVKIHTKKSPHRVDGASLRKDIIDKMLTVSQVKRWLEFMEKNQQVGILGPKGHVAPMYYKYQLNASKIENLALRMGITRDHVHRLSFVAGSMFMARTEALQPLMNLALGEEDFEKESGQVDGTLAHAVERLFAVSALAKRMINTCIPDPETDQAD